MSDFIDLHSPDDFAGGFFVDWSHQTPPYPQQTVVAPLGYTLANCGYTCDGQTIAIDPNQANLSLSQCKADLFNGVFTLGDHLVVVERRGTRHVFHAVFDPPVQAVGVPLGGGLDGEDYDAELELVATDGTVHRVPVSGTASFDFGSAVFAGAQATDGASIARASVRVQVRDADGARAFAIGPLYFRRG